jgi:hypothetical protein
MESLWATFSRIAHVPIGPVSVLPEHDVNVNHHVKTQVHWEAHDPDDEDGDEHIDTDDSTLPEGKDNQDRDDILLKINKHKEKAMLE